MHLLPYSIQLLSQVSHLQFHLHGVPNYNSQHKGAGSRWHLGSLWNSSEFLECSLRNPRIEKGLAVL